MNSILNLLINDPDMLTKEVGKLYYFSRNTNGLYRVGAVFVSQFSTIKIMACSQHKEHEKMIFLKILSYCLNYSPKTVIVYKNAKDSQYYYKIENVVARLPEQCKTGKFEFKGIHTKEDREDFYQHGQTLKKHYKQGLEVIVRYDERLKYARYPKNRNQFFFTFAFELFNRTRKIKQFKEVEKNKHLLIIQKNDTSFKGRRSKHKPWELLNIWK